MKNYWDQGERRNIQGSSNEEDTLPPHVYTIADDSYRSMLRKIEDSKVNSQNGPGRGRRRSPMKGKNVERKIEQNIRQ